MIFVTEKQVFIKISFHAKKSTVYEGDKSSKNIRKRFRTIRKISEIST